MGNLSKAKHCLYPLRKDECLKHQNFSKIISSKMKKLSFIPNIRCTTTIPILILLLAADNRSPKCFKNFWLTLCTIFAKFEHERLKASLFQILKKIKRDKKYINGIVYKSVLSVELAEWSQNFARVKPIYNYKCRNQTYSPKFSNISILNYTGIMVILNIFQIKFNCFV